VDTQAYPVTVYFIYVLLAHRVTQVDRLWYRKVTSMSWLVLCHQALAVDQNLFLEFIRECHRMLTGSVPTSDNYMVCIISVCLS
jgi:hypothetical protein